MKKAVLYLRSSKDRNDVSIDAQRRELEEFARSRNLAIVGEHADVVLSGKDEENRPAFQKLLRELAARDRAWSMILVLDTSRVARNQFIAHKLRHECKKHDADLVFSKTPELEGLAGIYLPAVLHAGDEGHSYMSKIKGLAGMQENVRRGWRAGGRAPIGYELEHVDTGAVREGQPVMKSRLVVSDQAPAIAAYLKARAAGGVSAHLRTSLGLEISPSSLNGVEWNALTYAGHTVWNVNQERVGKRYRGGQKRRPRSEWVIQRDTHAALISEDEAERILARLERGRARYSTPATYLFGGLIEAPGGAPWHGNSRLGKRYYRTGKVSITAEHLERVVLERVAADLGSDAFATMMAARLQRDMSGEHADRQSKAANQRLAEIDRKIGRLMALVQETAAPRPFLDRIEALELERVPAAAEAAKLARAAEAGREASQVRPRDVAAHLGGLAGALVDLSRDELKALIRGLVERLVIDPRSWHCRIDYAIRASGGVLVASPRGFEPRLSP